ncbi:MAG: hypothetical protein NTX79_08470 [Candidatus Micrarchaeota archaeon]|nr:hypothetical protein [Candidatus Micrarchaeota archaeon]
MEVKVRKTKEGVELFGSVPLEIANASALEIFLLRDGIYLLSARGAIGGQKAAGPLSEPELALVKKLLAIKFERRTPTDVDKTLSEKEKATLASLVARNMVNVFRSGKYEKGVYNVSDAVFGQTRDVLGAVQHAAGAPSAAGTGAAQRAAAPSAAKGTSAMPQRDPLARGWLVLDNEGDARQLSGSLEARIKAGEVAGLRSFDRKYYFIRKDFATAHQPKIMSALGKGDKTAEELSRVLGLLPEACLAILLHMAEEGELLEKSKGKFALA